MEGLTLLKDLMQEAKDLGLSKLVVEGDSDIVFSWVAKKEKGLRKFDIWLHQIFDIVIELGCAIRRVPPFTNQVLVRAKHLASFVGDFFAFLSSLSFSNIFLLFIL